MNDANNNREAVRRTNARQIKSDTEFRISSRVETRGRPDFIKVNHALIFAVLLLIAENAWALGHHPVQRHPYRRHWKESLTRKQAILGTVVGAGIGKHVGLGYATHAVGSTVEHLVAAPLHEDLHYQLSDRQGFGPRLRHALVSTVITRNTRSGKRQIAAGRLSGSTVSGAFAATVLPATSGASTAGIGLAVVAGTNVAREFWPRKKKVQAQNRSKHPTISVYQR